jgi:outer membrane biosynthesis protein TonB
VQSARQFAEYVRMVSEGKPLPGTPPSGDATVVIDATVRIAPPKDEKKRSKLPLVALASVVVLGITAAIAGWLFYRSAEKPAPVPVAAAPAAVVPEKPAVVPQKPRPKPVEKKIVKAEPKVAPAPPPPPPRPVVAKVEPAPEPKPVRTAKVVSLDRNWGFLVVESPEPGAMKVGDRLHAHLADGRRVAIVVRRISGNLVSAVPEGQKISDDMVGASVTK